MNKNSARSYVMSGVYLIVPTDWCHYAPTVTA